MITDPGGSGRTIVITIDSPIPETCDFTPDESTLYVGTSDGQLLRIDTASGTVTGTWTDPLGKRIFYVTTLPNGKVFMIAEDDSLQSSDIRVLEPDGTVHVLNMSFIPGSFSVAPGGKLAYVSALLDPSAGAVIDTDTEAIVTNQPYSVLGRTTGDALYAVLGYLPDCMAWPSSDPSYAYAAGAYGPAALNLSQQSVVFYYPGAGNIEQCLGLASHHQDDGSDLIVVLRDSEVKFFTATQPPMIYAVVSAGTGQNGPVAAGEIVSIYGANLPVVQTAEASSLPLPVQIGGTMVLDGLIPAPLLYISSTQINLINPQWTISAGVTKVGFQVQGPQGTTNQAALFIAKAAPDLLHGPEGQTLVDPTTNEWRWPRQLGGKVGIAYGTGFGPTSPSVVPGQPAPAKAPLAQVAGQLTLTACGVEVPGDQIYFAGLAPTLTGLYQVNMLVPLACETAADQSVSASIQ